MQLPTLLLQQQLSGGSTWERRYRVVPASQIQLNALSLVKAVCRKVLKADILVYA